MPCQVGMATNKALMNVQKSEELADALASMIRNLELPDERRARLSSSCFDIVHEHHRSIALLVGYRLYGSAFTLARPIYEAFVRGAWLRLCATEEQMQKVIDDEFSPSLPSLVSAIKKKDKNLGPILDKIRERHGPMFNSLTHAGFAQIARRNTQEHIEPNYDENEVGRIIEFADGLAILAGFQIAIIADNSELAVELGKKARQYYRHKPPPVGV